MTPKFKRYQNLSKPTQYVLVKSRRGNIPSKPCQRYYFQFELNGARVGNKWETIHKDVLECMLEDYVEVPTKYSDHL